MPEKCEQYLSVTWLWWSFERSAGFLLRLDICARGKKYTFPPSIKFQQIMLAKKVLRDP
jgi:hypothetical protein